jgi:hypothetical protein
MVRALHKRQGVELRSFPTLRPGNGVVQGSWFTHDAKRSAGPTDNAGTMIRQRRHQCGKRHAGIYQNVGGNFNAPPITNAQQVGTATLSFSACDKGTLGLHVQRRQRSQRQHRPDARRNGPRHSGARPVNRLAFSGNWLTLPPRGKASPSRSIADAGGVLCPAGEVPRQAPRASVGTPDSRAARR